MAFVVHQEGPEISKLALLEQISKLPPERIILAAMKDRMHLSIDWGFGDPHHCVF